MGCKQFCLQLRWSLLLPLLANCSVLREEARITYNPAIIVPGAAKEAIDAELGSPQMSEPNSSGERLGVYITSRVYQGAPDALSDGKLFIDVYTLGIAEIVNGFGFTDDTRQKEFRILYSQNDLAEDIELTCFSNISKDFNDPNLHHAHVTGDSKDCAVCYDGLHMGMPHLEDSHCSAELQRK